MEKIGYAIVDAMIPGGSVIEDLAEELGCSVVFRMVEKCLWIILLDDFPLVHENNAIGDGSGKAHFVGHAEHSHARMGQINHNIKYFFDHFRIEC